MDSDSSPLMVLDESCLNEKDYSLCLMGKVKDFATLANLKVVVANEGFDNIKFKYIGGVTWVEIEGPKKYLVGFSNFVEDNDEEEDSKVGSYEEVPNGNDVKNVEDLEGDSDGEIVPHTKFEEDFPNQKGEEDSVRQGNMQSEDPFDIYELLNHKRPVIDKNSNSKESLKYPLGYTLTGSHFKKSDVPKSGDSILQLIDDLVKVRETIRGDWMPNGKKLLIISVYAPQALDVNKLLWDYLSLMMSKWEGEVVIIGDFNDVRNKSERFGTLLNRQSADVFNRFIPNAGLEEVPLEGCSLT
uniref:RNA-directed DNA polymerase, eukaryota n=1 Tax=Tanacetum cinerariifolium TaxID=118510 RepID=A0A699K9K8_TANCI|nr:RNA-directed DNA polymerase, eukaryota [Tanacetum cinerariifolium]